ncbi:MAG: TatD family hydrolase [Verrucomicrobia bacterium]|jgi:TatD DNase family protein|nr:TatD family hydrolase [Verrucomicrobiota bacterium]
MTEFYDTHAHIDYPEFQSDWTEVLRRAQQAGVSRIIGIGTDWESSRRVVSLAERHDFVYAVVGWHPSHALEAPADIRPELRQWAGHPRVVGLGETGLDYYRLPSSQGGSEADDGRYKLRQAELFEQHLEVAAESGLNCVIHQRAALEDCLQQLRPYAPWVRGQFHCFSDDSESMRRILALGSLVSFTGILTFKNGQNIRDTLATTPLGSFLLETDCPYLAPVPYRGKRCEPAHVREIAECAASVKGCSLEALSQATCEAAKAFFPKLG